MGTLRWPFRHDTPPLVHNAPKVCQPVLPASAPSTDLVGGPQLPEGMVEQALTWIRQGARRLRWPLQSGQQSLLAVPNPDGTIGVAAAACPTRAVAALPGLLLAMRPVKEPHPQAGGAHGAGGGAFGSR